jgi:hypothetical protein
MPAV